MVDAGFTDKRTSPDTRRSVVVFRLQLFKPSETFIVAQARTYARYDPIYVGLKRFGEAPEGAAVVCPRLTPAQKIGFLLGKVGPITRALPAAPAVVHAHFAVDAVFALPLALHYRVPLIVTLHGFDVTTRLGEWLRSGKPALMLAALRRRRLQRRATRFLAVSDAIRAIAVARGFPAERTDVAYLGINLSRFMPSPTPPSRLIVHVGRLVEKKGTHDLLSAFAIVAKRWPDARLTIAGDGPLLASLRDHAARLGIDAAVTFAGARTHAEVLELMRAAQVIAVPSVTAASGDREGLPTVILEAAALARAVVATRHSGIPESVVDGETGLLVDERDPAALALALIETLADPARARAMGEAARRLVEERFDARRLTAALEARYDDIITGHAAR